MSAVAPPPRAAETALPESPYKGLMHYSAQDAEFFFGREREVALIAANLTASRLTLLYGASGVGKSSLLRAGVERRLSEEAARSFRERGAPDAVPVVFSSWRDDPIDGLAAALATAAAPFAEGAPPEVPPGRLDLLLAAWSERLGAPLLLVLDQFEEYFLYHGDEDGEGTFAVEFPRAVNRPDLRANFVVSIREDALAGLDRFKGRIPLLFDTYLRIEHLDRAAARAAIAKPLERYNELLPAGEERYALEPGLTEAVLDQVRTGEVTVGESGRGVAGNGAGSVRERIETPYLQLVLSRIWNEERLAGSHTLGLATLERLGGAERIVRAHLDETLDALAPRDQEVAASVFRYLVTASGTKVAHSASDLAEYTGLPEAEIEPVLQRLSAGDNRIVRPVPPPPGEPGGERFEIFHDVLAAPLLEWRRRFEHAREREADARRQRAVRRKLVLIAVGLLCLVLAFAGFAAWALHERSIAQDRADVAESQALAARSLRVQSLDPRLSLELAERAEATSATPQAEEALRRALVASPQPTVLVAPGRATYGVDFSPDGQFVATAGGGGAFVRSTTGQLVATLVPRKLVYSARFSRPDGRFLVTAGADGAIRLWRVHGWRELPSPARILPHLLARADFSADGRYLVAGGHPGWPNRVWRFEAGRVGQRLTARDGVAGWIDPDGTARVVDARTAAWAARVTETAPFAFASSPDGRLLAVAPEFEATRVYRTATQRLVTALPPADGAVFSPDGRRLATESYRSAIWNIGHRRPEAVLARSVAGAAFSPGGELFVGASATRAIARVWDSRSGAVLAELPPRPPRFHRAVVLPDPYPSPGGSSIAPGLQGSGTVSQGPGPAFELRPAASFSAAGDLVATWGREKGGAQLWQPFGTRLLMVLRTGSRAADEPLLLPVAVSSDGALVAIAGRGNQIEVWDTRDGGRVSPLRGSKDFVSSIAFDTRGDLVAAGSFDGAVRLWRTADGRRLRTFGVPHVSTGFSRGDRVGGVAISPDGKLLASASEDGTARIWNVGSGEHVVDLDHDDATVNAVSFSPDGGSLVTAGGDGAARVWSTSGWKREAVLGPTGRGAPVLRASFSQDGRFVVTLDQDGNARIWRSSGGKPIRTLANVGSIAVGPDGARLVTGGGDATARILRLDDGVEPPGVLRGHTNTVSGARFGADGDLIVTAGLDGTVRVWEAATEGTVAVVRPSAAPVVDAMLVADGRLVAVSEDGVRFYACEPCLRPAELRAAAAQRLK